MVESGIIEDELVVAWKERMAEKRPPTPRLGDKEFHVAPMLDVSTREFRYFIRLLTKRSFLWTEMVVAETLQHCDPKEYDQHLAYEKDGHPIVCQIGGNVPSEAVLATKLVQQYGYDRIDLNAECPSDRVTGRREFGAALMKDIGTAVDMVKAMVETSNSDAMPVSVKTRIGVDDEDCMEFLLSYIGRLVEAGCRRFVIHSRKVHTKGLSPAQNRAVPPLNYQKVYALCEAFPRCHFWLNGGIRSLEDARKIAYGAGCEFDGRDGKTARFANETSNREAANHGAPCETCNQPYGSCIAPSPHLSPGNLMGVMVGRLAMDNPCALADVDRYMFGEDENPCRTRRELIEKYARWIEKEYPRRCCDDDPTVTLGRVVGGSANIPRVRSCCSVCQEYYKNDEEEENSMSNESGEENQYVCNTSSASDSQFTMSQRRHKRHVQKSPGSKMVSSVIDRPLKPILGVFAGLKGNAKFRREIHRLSRDMTVRNCGPGYVLRKAVECISSDILDGEFAKCDG